jgi:uncharacterized protein YjbI with pentapeptide repeats
MTQRRRCILATAACVAFSLATPGVAHATTATPRPHSDGGYVCRDSNPTQLTGGAPGGTDYGGIHIVLPPITQRKFKGYLIKSNANLSGVNLSGVDLSSMLLSKVNFTNANLTGANLSDITLSSSNFTNANLTGANLNGAYLHGDNFSNAVMEKVKIGQTKIDSESGAPKSLPTGWTFVVNQVFTVMNSRYFFSIGVGPGADLTSANLKGLNLSKADLTGADLSGADLSGTALSKTYLYGTRAVGITGNPSALPMGYGVVGGTIVGPGMNAQKVDFSAKNFTGVSLFKADLTGANLDGANLTGVIMVGAQLRGLHATNFTGVPAVSLPIKMVKTALVGPGLDASKYDFTGSSLTGVNLSNSKLDGANISGVSFLDAKLTGVSAVGLVGTPTDLPSPWRLVSHDLAGPGAKLVGLTLGTKYDIAGLDLTNADLTNADLTGADLRGTTLAGTILTGVAATNIDTYLTKLPAGYFVRGGFPIGSVLLGGNLVGPGVSLNGASLNGLDFSGVSLAKADLTGVDFSGSYLTNVILTGAKVSCADFRSVTTLSGLITGRMTGTPLLPLHTTSWNGYLVSKQVNLENADLHGGSFWHFDFTGGDMSGINFAGAVCTVCNFTNATMNRANLKNFQATSATFDAANLANANVAGAVFSSSTFNRALVKKYFLYQQFWFQQPATLAGASGALIANSAQFDHAVLAGANLSDGKLLFASFNNADLRQIDLTRVVASWADFTSANLSGGVLSGATFNFADLKTANLASVTTGESFSATGAKLPPGWSASVDGFLVDPGKNKH